MHIINDCPRCGKDFMYHQSDAHLRRNVLVGSNGYEHLKPIVICQDCNEIENIAEFIKEKAEHRGWENAEYMSADKFGEDKTLKAIEFLGKNDVSNVSEK